MNRTIYWIAILVSPVLIAGVSLIMPKETQMDFFTKALLYSIIFYIPLITFFRMRYLKFNYKQMLLSMVPFYGAKYRRMIYYEN